MSRARVPIEWRLWTKVRPVESGCWEWQGKKSGQGRYGCLSVGHSGRVYTHRLAYELCNGPIAPGLFVCHRCDNPPCCNPTHLFLGTCLENGRDMVSKGRGYARRTHCKHGHELTPDNVESYGPYQRRICKTCRRRRVREWNRKHRAKAAA